MVRDIVDEGDIDVDRNASIVELPRDRSNIPDVFLLVPLIDVVEQVLLNIDGVRNACGSNGFGQRPGEKAGSRFDVGDDHSRLQLQIGDDVIDFLVCESGLGSRVF